MTLITAFEVVSYSPAGRDYPTKHICDALDREVESFMHSCFGDDFTTWLVDHLTQYPPNVVEWVSGTTYATDDIVLRFGCLFTSNIDNNTTDPADDPGDPAEWSALPKFTDDCANFLWIKYLRQILAFRVYMSTLNFSTTQSGAGGLVIMVGDGTGRRNATKAEISDMKTTLMHQSDMASENLLRWLQTQRTNTECTLPFNLLETCSTNDCRPPGKGVRRWAFKH